MPKLTAVNPSHTFLVGIDTGGTYIDAVLADLDGGSEPELS